MDIKKKTVTSLFWKFLERGGRGFIELVVQIALARMLTPSDFGLLAIIVVFINIGNVVVQSGLGTALVQTPTVHPEDYSTVFWMSFTISVMLYLVIFFGAPSIAFFYNMEGIVWPLRVLSLILFVNAYNAVQIAQVSRSLNFKIIFRATIISVMVSGIVGIAFAAWGFGVWALVFQQLLYQVTNCLAMFYHISWKPSIVFNFARAKKLFSFGWKLLVSGFLETGYQSLSDLIIGKQFTTMELGLVSQGKKYPQAIGSMLDGAIQPVMLSTVSRIQDNAAYIKRVVRRALKTSTYLIVPTMACFALVAKPLVSILLGEQWLSCVPFLQMYCFIFALLPIHTSNLQALNGMGRSDLFLKLEFIKKSYGIVILCFTAFVLHNIYAIIAGYVVSGIINTFVNALPNRRILDYSYIEQLKDIAPAFILSAVSVGIACPIAFFGLPAILEIATQVCLVAVVYLSLSKLFHIEAFSYLRSTVKEAIDYKKC